MAKTEQFKIETFKRSLIHEAIYNPRKIGKEARAKLKKGLKQFGLVQPIIVNKKTMNVVSGHQRLSIMDELEGNTDYDVLCAVVDKSEEDEKKLNMLLNNQGVMGEWDFTALSDMSFDLGIDGMFDCGFEKSELFIMGIDVEETEEIEKTKESYSKTCNDKKKIREENSKKDDEGVDNCITSKDDYNLIFVFPTNTEKKRFMRLIEEKENVKTLRSSKLFDIGDGKFDLHKIV